MIGGQQQQQQWLQRKTTITIITFMGEQKRYIELQRKNVRATCHKNVEKLVDSRI